jgi:hypothetical protein
MFAEKNSNHETNLLFPFDAGTQLPANNGLTDPLTPGALVPLTVAEDPSLPSLAR